MGWPAVSSHTSPGLNSVLADELDRGTRQPLHQTIKTVAVTPTAHRECFVILIFLG
jgi:hypothetical protein